MLRSPEAVEQKPSGNIKKFGPRFHIFVSENASHVALETGKFPWEWLNDKPERKIDRKMIMFFSDLQTGAFWRVLGALDGRYSFIDPDSKGKREEARKWAKENFTHYELNKLLDICVGIALTVPFELGAPGSKRGHSTLYEELAEKPDSMFAEAVTPEFRKRLNNGRFWEELADMGSYSQSYSHQNVEDVLMNNFQDLDIEFAPEGYKLFKRNDGENGVFHIGQLSDRALNRYIAFVEQIQNKAARLGIQSNQTAHLVRPYVEAIIATTGEGEDEFEEPRFPEEKRRSFMQRLHEPIVVEHLTHSKLVRSAAARELYLHASYGNRDLEYVLKIISNIPRPNEMFDLMIASSHHPKNTLEEITAQAFKEGLDLPIGPISHQLYRS